RTIRTKRTRRTARTVRLRVVVLGVLNVLVVPVVPETAVPVSRPGPTTRTNSAVQRRRFPGFTGRGRRAGQPGFFAVFCCRGRRNVRGFVCLGERRGGVRAGGGGVRLHGDPLAYRRAGGAGSRGPGVGLRRALPELLRSRGADR